MTLDLQGMKNLFRKGMSYAKDNFSSAFYSFDDNLANYVLNLADNAPDTTTLFNAIFMASHVKAWSSLFTAPKLLPPGYEFQHTGIQFGVGPVEWYFFYGLTGTPGVNETGLNLTFFRLDIAPPAVVKEMGIDPSNACCWGIMGGYGTKEKWTGIPAMEWFPMKYVQPDYATFSLTGKGTNVSATLESLIPMQFSVNVSFLDSNSQAQTIKAKLIALTPPTANFPYACQCGYGLGTMYYSYTNMSLTMGLNGSPEMVGQGWIDHQLLKSGIVDGFYMQAIQSASQTLVKQKSGGWLWFAVQDNQTGLQYMFMHKFGTKDFKDDIRLNEDIRLDLVNVYKEGVPYFFPEAKSMKASVTKIKMVETIQVPELNLSLPSKYKITLPGGKKIVLENITAPNIYPCSFASYETPAHVYDELGNLIGQGLIEANFYLDEKTLFKRYIASAGGDPEEPGKVDLLLNASTPSGFRKFLAFCVFLTPLWIFAVALIYVFRKDDGMRHKRLFTAVLVIIFATIIVNIYSEWSFRSKYIYKEKYQNQNMACDENDVNCGNSCCPKNHPVCCEDGCCPPNTVCGDNGRLCCPKTHPDASFDVSIDAWTCRCTEKSCPSRSKCVAGRCV